MRGEAVRIGQPFPTSTAGALEQRRSSTAAILRLASASVAAAATAASARECWRHLASGFVFVPNAAVASPSPRAAGAVPASATPAVNDLAKQWSSAGAAATAQGIANVGALVCGLAAVALHRRQRGPRLPRTGRASAPTTLRAEAVATKSADLGPVPEDLDWSRVSNEWEIDCFSRPVQRDGKKMWELLLTDANAVYRRVAQMKPTRVNSVVVQKILAIFLEESKVKPRVIRFYRKVMKNMLTVALNSIKDEKDIKGLKILPSRNCHMLRRWISYRERTVYPKMEGYIPPPPKRPSPVQAQMVQMAYEDIPGKLKFARYAFSCIPYGAISQVQPGTVPGSMCRVPMNIGEDVLIHGVILLSSRAEAIASILRSLELCNMRVNLESNDLLMDLGIDSTYKVAKVPQEDKETCLEFERSKRALGGLHFVAVHNPVTGGEVNLPIQAEQMGGEGCISGLWLCIDYSLEDTA